MQLRHGGLTIEVPDDWEDRSTLLFVAPRDTAELPTVAAVQRPTEAVAIAFVRVKSGETAEDVMRSQAEQARALNPEFEVSDAGPIDSALGSGWCQTQSLTVFDMPVRQLSAAFVVGPVAVVATASAAESRFARCSEMLSSVLRSLGPAEG